MHLARALSLALAVLLLPGLLLTAPAAATQAPSIPESDTQLGLDAVAHAKAVAGLLAERETSVSKLATIRVNVMPSTAIDPNTGTFQPGSWIGRDNILWGNVTAGTPPYTYEWSFGDGSPNASGPVVDTPYVRVHHTYNTLGPKFATLTVTDADGDSDSETVRIDVGAYTIASRVQAAIADGLRYIYLNQNSSGYWNTSTSQGKGDGLMALAYHLRGHDKGNDPDSDIYAETLDAFWSWIWGDLRSYSIGAQSAGDPDANGNGLGVYSANFNSGYAHGSLMLAMTAIDDLDEVIPSGTQAGRTIREVLQDMADMAGYSQTDGGTGRGGWQYTIATSNSGCDNSANQWIVLALAAAEDLGLTVPQFVKDENEIWTLYSQSGTGGFGYTSVSYWENIAKTASGAIQLGWLGYDSTGPEATAAIGFLNTHWADASDGFGVPEHLRACYYAAYAVKKGMEEFVTPVGLIGGHEWQDEYNKTLVHDVASDYDGIGGVGFNNDLMEQQYGANDLTDGRWTSAYWLSRGAYVTETATAVLILNQGVTSQVPVPVCSITPPQAGPGDLITLDASGSFHQDPDLEIIEYLWDFDASDGLDWLTPDASGVTAQTSYALEVGELSREFVVTLRVKDDGQPQQSRESRCTVLITRENNPPVAVPGGPYSACVGEEICVDGSASYDPDEDEGDFVAAYRWDLDGDGQFDDFDGPATCFTLPGLYDGFIGLQVEDSYGAVSQNQSAVIRIFTALGDLNTEDSDLVLNSDDGCVQGGTTCVTGSYRVLSDEPNYVVAEARVSFFVDNPNDPAKRFATFVDANLVDGMVITHSACFVRPDDQPHVVYMVVDPNGAVNECVETDNVAMLDLPCGQCETDVDLVLVDYETVSWDPVTAIWEVRVSVRNEGPGDAFDVNAALVEEIDWVTPIVGTSSYGDVAAGVTKFGTPFTLDLTGWPQENFNVFFTVSFEDCADDRHEIRLDPEAVLPTRTGLSQNYPNPFNPYTKIQFTLREPTNAKLEIFDVRGRLVTTMVDAMLTAKTHVFEWNGTDDQGRPVSSGLYYYRLTAKDYVETKKMTLVK